MGQEWRIRHGGSLDAASSPEGSLKSGPNLNLSCSPEAEAGRGRLRHKERSDVME
jgi:hypothetical protein